MKFQDLSSENRTLNKIMGSRPLPQSQQSWPGKKPEYPHSDPQQGWPKFRHRIHNPLAGELRLSKQQPQLAAPKPSTHSRRSRAVAHPCAKHVRGGVGGRAHAVVMEAEAPHTDLETPVVWLLMEIREEMVMRGWEWRVGAGVG